MMTGLLVACASNQTKQTVPAAPAAPTQPCWLENPVSAKWTGQTGSASALWIGGEKPLVTSKKRALSALGQYVSVDTAEIEIKEDSQTAMLAGQTVYFSEPYTQNGQIITFASYQKLPANTPQCAVSHCAISQCDPAWLCESSKKGELTQLGISYLTANPGKQQDNAVRNAQNIAKFLYGANITASKQLKTVHTSTGTMMFLHSDNQLEKNLENDLPYLVTHSCRSGETLFTRVKFKSEGYQPVAENNPQLWLRNPKYQGIDGAVGSAEKMVASGLFSKQIDLAVRRAIVQLALEKESNLSEDLINIEYGHGGTLLVSTIDEKTRVNLKAILVALHITGEKDDQPKVYAWVARVQD